MKTLRDLRRDIEIPDGQIDQVREGGDVLKSACAIFNHTNDAIDSFANSIGQTCAYECDDIPQVVSKCFDEAAQGFKSTLEGGCHPSFDEALGSTGIGVFPEGFELIFKNPGSPDTAVTLSQRVEHATLGWGAVCRVAIQQPPQPLDGLALCCVLEFAPLVFAHFVDGIIEGFDNMKAVDDQLSPWTPVFDSADVCLRHVAGGEANVCTLKGAHLGFEEAINGLSPLSVAHPDHTAAVKIIHDGSVAASALVGDLIDADSAQGANPMATADSVNGTMQHSRECRGTHIEQLCGSALGHGLTVAKNEHFEPIGDLCVRRSPRYALLSATMSSAADLSGGIVEVDIHAAHSHITPAALLGHGAQNTAAAATLGASTAIAVGFDPQVQLFPPFFEGKSLDPQNSSQVQHATN